MGKKDTSELYLWLGLDVNLTEVEEELGLVAASVKRQTGSGEQSENRSQ